MQSAPEPEGSLCWPCGDIGRHWGNVRVMLGLYGDNGKENGNHYNGL